eukprot:TRINITY_DN135_c0_g1_i1.p1 TRINITY_DN135_c0_g1~~TRINITY_DN135_c0_g1_i1.p1  ORF type:complete len:466 (+),score=73.83 TRINITY_DN135_c0_g1_i1:71-1399(+)
MALASCTLHLAPVSLYGRSSLQYSGQNQGLSSAQPCGQPAIIKNRLSSPAAAGRAASVNWAGHSVKRSNSRMISPAPSWKQRLYDCGESQGSLTSRLEYMLQCSLTPGRRCPSYVALSSELASHAAWESFGVYTSTLGHCVSQQFPRKCQKNVIVMGGLLDNIDSFLARRLSWAVPLIGSAILVLALGSFSFVPSGSVGIRTTFGQVEQQVLLRGLHFNYPLVSDIQTLTTKTQLIVADESDVPTKEGLVVELDVSILHSLQPSSAADLYITVGPDYVRKIILPELHSAVANITSEYSARALYTDARAQLTRELTSYLQQKLTHKGIVIEDVLLRAIKLPEQLTNAIQDKLRTEQEAQRMEFVLLKEQQEAERKRIEAEGIATFQKIVSEGISPQLLQWKGIEATQELAKSPNSKIVVIGNAKDGLPIILGGEDQIIKAKRR